jgi:hypothetical protein
VNKHKNKLRRLELKKEMIVHLSNDLLKNVVGGSTVDAPTASLPISKCCQ